MPFYIDNAGKVSFRTKNQVEKLQEKYKITIVTVPKLTMGAAITALAAHKAINPEYDIILQIRIIFLMMRMF